MVTTDQVWETPHGVKLRFPTDNKPYFRLDYIIGGRRRQPSVGRDQDAAWAEALRADTLVAVDNGELGELSAAELFEAWWTEGCTHWSDTYQVYNRDLLDKHILDVVRSVAVVDLRRSHITACVASGSTARMQAVIRSACSSALHWAEEQGWTIPAAKSLLPPKPRGAKERQVNDTIDKALIPDIADALALADWMAKPRQPKRKKGRVAVQAEYRQYTVLVAAFCGLRLGEMLALKGKHVNGDVLTVETQVQSIRGKGTTVSTPKWGSARKVVIPAQAGKYKLADWMARRAKQVGPDGLLFPAPEGGLWPATNYRKSVFNPAREAVWPGKPWSYHSLRHTFCTSLLTRGVSLNDVAAMAGHSSPMVTAAAYIGRQASTLDRVRSAVNE